MKALEPGLMVIHGNRMEELRALALAWMERQPLAPLENETILVHSNGVAQWLKMALAEGSAHGGLGIAAALDVQLPGRFLWQAYRAVLGPEAVEPDSPYNKDALVWRLLRLLPELLPDPAFAPLAAYLADDSDLRKRHQLAERLADLFDQYQVYRADWLHAWQSGHDHLLDVQGQPRPLPEGQDWQPRLWRAVVHDIGTEAASRSGIHPLFLEKAAQLRERPAGLPRRLIVFGISALPAQALQAFSALARFCQIMMFVLNPCRHYWADIVRDRDVLRAQRRRHKTKAGMPEDLDESNLHLHAHPLLAAWGRQGRDYIRLLDEYDDPETYRHLIEGSAVTPDLRRLDLFSKPDSRHVLGQLQDDILDLRPLVESRSRWPLVDAQADPSIRFHMAHSPQREVEVLHDQLLAYFEQMPGLKPRDIVVMVPDIERYAPHVLAVFGQYHRDDGRYIPFTLADRRQRGRAPLLLALEALLNITESRLSASDVLDLLDVPALRARLKLTEADLPTLQRWISDAGIRWGLHAEHRAALGLPEDLQQNTWDFGLQRMLLGYAVADGPAWHDIQPYEEIGGLDAALLGPLALLLEHLHGLWHSLRQPCNPEQWGLRLRQMMVDFFAPESDEERQLLAQLDTLLSDWQDHCAAAQLHEALPLAVVREAWLSGLDQGGLSQRFMGGAVNFCTLMPMRAIPFRVVCLLGMNDGDYPRPQAASDFDLMAKDYRPGDRSRREDDRYLFLEALLSARERLYISWVGRSPRDNSERPPSVLVGQLRDHLNAAWASQDQQPLASALSQSHALQPFNPRYFQDGPWFSFAGEWLGASQSVLSSPNPSPENEHASLAAPAVWPPLNLESLIRLLRQPVRFFFNQRLHVYFDAEEEALADHEPFSLDALESVLLTDELLAQVLPVAGDEAAIAATLAQSAQALRRQGRLPMAGLGDLLLEQLQAPLPQLAQSYAAALERWPELITEPLALEMDFTSQGSELTLSDWLGPLRRGEAGLARLLPMARPVHNKDSWHWTRLLAPWVVHVIANATGLALHTEIIASDDTLHWPPLEQEQAQNIAHAWIDAWQTALCRPLPLAPKTAFALLEKDLAAAQLRYEGSDQTLGERPTCPYLTRHYPNFQSLTAQGEFEYWAGRVYGGVWEWLGRE